MHKLILLAVFVAAFSFAQPNDYSKPASWLCRPGQHYACDIDLTTTIIAPDGKLTRENMAADPKAAIDCFYVYPTVSTDPTPNSDMVADEAERNVSSHDLCRFQRCQA